MPDPPRYPDSEDDTHDHAGAEPDRAASTGTSRWQKVVGILGLVVILWVGNQMFGQLTGRGGGLGGPGGGGAGPGQHEPPAEMQEQEPDSEDGGGHRFHEGGRDH